MVTGDGEEKVDEVKHLLSNQSRNRALMSPMFTIL
jgi:hypothetical protein